LGTVLFFLVARKWVAGLDARIVVAGGVVLTMIGTVPFALADSEGGSILLSLGLILQGFGAGAGMFPVMALALAGLSHDETPSNTAAFSVVQRVGAPFGVAIFAVIFTTLLSNGQGASPALAAFSGTFWWIFGLSAIPFLLALFLPTQSTSNKAELARPELIDTSEKCCVAILFNQTKPIPITNRKDRASMPKAPAIIGNLVESIMGRQADVLDIREPARGFLELTLRATPPSGGWHPGHELQFRVSPTQGRRYTIRTVCDTDDSDITIVAATDADGPGTRWIGGLHVATRISLLASKYFPLPRGGSRLLYLGDGSSIGTIDAYAHSDNDAIAVIEVPGDAVGRLADQWPAYQFLPTSGAPGDSLQAWLEQAITDGRLTNRDGAVLLGHAQSIQRQRRALVESGTLSRRAITTKPYWADGREGL
jgi:NADPH-dependent ferric siderophore reductase